MLPETKSHAPAAASRLAQAEATLGELENSLGPLSLAASENESGAEKKLAQLETQIGAARRELQKLQSAHSHAVLLDRRNTASAAAKLRDEQLADFTAAMQARGKEMAAVLQAAATMAAAFGRYSEQTLRASISAPIGTVIPAMAIGPNGSYGPAFGPCERLILTELWRVAPERKDGAGRFILPIARSPSITNTDRAAFSPALEEFATANRAIVAEIATQVEQLNGAMAAATKEAA